MISNEQRIQRQRLERREFVLLSVICLVAILMIVMSGRYYDVNHTPNAKRYEHDIHAKFGYPERQEPFSQKGYLPDNGTVEGGELSAVCGATWHANFYQPTSRPHRLELLDTCQVSPQQQEQIRQTVITKVTQLQRQIATKYQYFIQHEKGRDIQENVIGFNTPKEAKEYFRESLSLNNSGKSQILAEIPALLNSTTEPRELLAILAAIEGDTAFPYSQVFQGEYSHKSVQLNETASLVRRIVRINTEWATKTTKVKKIISPIGSFVFAGLILSAFFLIRMVRRQQRPWRSLGIMLMSWSLLGTILNFGFIEVSYTKMAVLALLGVLSFVLLSFNSMAKKIVRDDNILPFQMPTTSLGYAFFALCLWISFIIMLELSVNGIVGKRFLLLNHFTACYWALFVLTVAPTVANILAHFLSKIFARTVIAAWWANSGMEKIVRVGVLLSFIALGLAVVLLGNVSLNNWIEALKIVFIFGLALIATTSRFSVQSKSLSWKLYFVLLVVIATPMIAMAFVGEMGTILVLAYSGIVIFGAYLQYVMSSKGNVGHSHLSQLWHNMGAIILSLTALFVTTAALIFWMPGERPTERIMSMINPFGSTNDQMAIIHWLRHSTPPIFGYSLGDVPWCGYDSGCDLPGQMQSDYTATSIIVLSGWFIGLSFFLAYLYWLVSFLRGHLTSELGIRYGQQNLGQVFLLWSGIIWVIVTSVQMIVTVLGNFGILPLTGVTFPFVSYGMSSLLACSFFIGLLINRPLTQPVRQKGDI